MGGIIREARRVLVDTELKQAAVASQKGRPRLGQGGPRQLAPSGQTPWLRCSRPQYKGGLDEPYHLGSIDTANKKPPKGFFLRDFKGFSKAFWAFLLLVQVLVQVHVCRT